MDLQTWVSIASLLAVGLALWGGLTRQLGGLAARLDGTRVELKADIGALSARLDDTRAELKGDIAGLRTELKGDIGRLDARMEQGFGRVESRLNGLDQRAFELSTRLPPLPTRAE